MLFMIRRCVIKQCHMVTSEAINTIFQKTSDYTRNKSAGEHPQSVKDAFDEEKGETEPVLGVFEGNTTGPLK